MSLWKRITQNLRRCKVYAPVRVQEQVITNERRSVGTQLVSGPALAAAFVSFHRCIKNVFAASLKKDLQGILHFSGIPMELH